MLIVSSYSYGRVEFFIRVDLFDWLVLVIMVDVRFVFYVLGCARCVRVKLFRFFSSLGSGVVMIFNL